LKEGMERAVVCSSFKGHAGRKTVSATLKAENKKQDEKLKKKFWIFLCNERFSVCTGVARFFLLQHTKMGETKPKDHNKYQMIIMYTK
jgi:heme/copper-type cytochrome/quinol oxidase subunit 3